MMYHRRHQHENRVNEQHVPESQHTIFVRGLPGDMSTNVVKEFFDEHIGPCSFDFIKVSQDRSKLFVAVRFESKSAAKDAMDRYKDNEILGYPVEITFFRDIRRYIAHVQKQGGPSASNGGGRVYNQRNDFRNNGPFIRKRFIPRRRSRSHSRSASRTNSRSGSHSKSRSPASRSPSRSRSRSTQRSSAMSNRKPDDLDEVKKEARETTISPPPKKIKKIKKDKKKKKKHSPTPSPSPKSRRSNSDMDTSDGEMVLEQQTPISKKSKESERPASKTVSSGVSTPVRTMVSPPAVNIGPMMPSVLLKNSSITVDLDSNKVPQQKMRHSPMEQYKLKSELKTTSLAMQNGSSSKHTFVAINNGENGKRFKEDFKEVTSSMDIKPTSELGGAMTNFSAIQRRILQDVRYKNETVEEDDDQCGNFRLSALSTQKMTEALREEKISKMSPELREKINRRKMQLELSYRKDCETFGLMTKKLIAKDRGLEDRLRLALLEVMKDLETEAMKQLDDYLEQMIFLSC